MLCHVSASQINSLNGIANGETLEYWTAVAHAIAAIENDTRCLTPRVQTKHGLLLEEDLWRAKLFEKDVCGFHTITVWVQWWLCEEDWMLLSRHLELIEDVTPQLLHIVPVLNNSVLNWIVEFQDPSVFIL